MLANTDDRTTTTTTPLLDAGSGHGEEGRWWKKLLDVEEAKNQVLFSLPMILTNLSYYLITLASVMFAGHLGESELAGATLANSWATIATFTGFGLMVGLSGALETLCGQGFYWIGMTVAGLLGFKMKLYAKGLWIGLICGLSSQTAALLLISLRNGLKWISHNDALA